MDAGAISAECRAAAASRAQTTNDDISRYADPEDFVIYIEGLRDLATKFTADTGDGTGVNRLVLQYLRSNAYNDEEFKRIIGAAQADFVQYVDRTHYSSLWSGYIDPKECLAVHADHWAVSTEGFLQYPAPAPGDVNWADFLGWGGDLISYYGIWRQNWGGDAAWCRDHLFTPGTTFDLRDMIEDADAFNMGTQIHTGASDDIGALVRDNLLGGGYADRFKRFGDGRFATRDGGVATATTMLTGNPSDSFNIFGLSFDLFAAYRKALVLTNCGVGCSDELPEFVDSGELAGFVDCFVDKLISIQA